MSLDSEIDHVWNLVDNIRACMLVTISGHGMKARPMHALPEREAGCLWFITDQRGAKDDEIKAAPEVCLAYGAAHRAQGQLFYCFNISEAFPEDHQVRRISGVSDVSWVHAELTSHYSQLGRPSIEPVLMIRMLIVGYPFAIRSERALCRESQSRLESA